MFCVGFCFTEFRFKFRENNLRVATRLSTPAKFMLGCVEHYGLLMFGVKIVSTIE